MKRLIAFAALALLAAGCCTDKGICRKSVQGDAFTPSGNWKLEWVDDFNGRGMNPATWNQTRRRSYQTLAKDVASTKGGALYIRARELREDDGTAGVNGYTAGDVDSKGKKYFSLGKDGIHGRLDIRAKMSGAEGFQPAIWMKPDNYPYDGEIDIMEHLNYKDFTYHTIHTIESIENPRRTSAMQRTAAVKYEDWNIYSVEGDSTGLRLFINDEQVASYSKEESGGDRYPFDTCEYFLLISNQISEVWAGRDYPGKILPSGVGMPCYIAIDFVRYYTAQ